MQVHGAATTAATTAAQSTAAQSTARAATRAAIPLKKIRLFTKVKLFHEIVLVTNVWYSLRRRSRCEWIGIYGMVEHEWCELTCCLLSGGYEAITVPSFIADVMTKGHVYSVNLFQEAQPIDPIQISPFVIAEVVADLGPVLLWRGMLETHLSLDDKPTFSDQGDHDSASTLTLPGGGDANDVLVAGHSDAETRAPMDDDIIISPHEDSSDESDSD